MMAVLIDMGWLQLVLVKCLSHNIRRPDSPFVKSPAHLKGGNLGLSPGLVHVICTLNYVCHCHAPYGVNLTVTARVLPEHWYQDWFLKGRIVLDTEVLVFVLLNVVNRTGMGEEVKKTIVLQNTKVYANSKSWYSSYSLTYAQVPPCLTLLGRENRWYCKVIKTWDYWLWGAQNSGGMYGMKLYRCNLIIW